MLRHTLHCMSACHMGPFIQVKSEGVTCSCNCASVLPLLLLTVWSDVEVACGVAAGSWQEMAAVLDMLQDMSVPSDSCHLGRPASATSPALSPARKPRCASAVSPSSASKAAGRQPRCSSPFSPSSPTRLRMRQKEPFSPSTQQHLLSGPLSPSGSARSRTPLRGNSMGSPLYGTASHRQDWQS